MIMILCPCLKGTNSSTWFRRSMWFSTVSWWRLFKLHCVSKNEPGFHRMKWYLFTNSPTIVSDLSILSMKSFWGCRISMPLYMQINAVVESWWSTWIHEYNILLSSTTKCSAHFSINTHNTIQTCYEGLTSWQRRLLAPDGEKHMLVVICTMSIHQLDHFDTKSPYKPDQCNRDFLLCNLAHKLN